jgi:transcriptional regulator with XRE-family HTH domain
VVANANHLGEFLRARREQITPHDVGLPDDGRRRVPGLRREELALLAGVSADYYMRLEQGRDHRPSEQILDALATALRLDDAAVTHLYELARPSRPVSRPAADDAVPLDLRDLLDAWTTTPAVVQNRRLDTVASNALARALTPALSPGGNALRATFLDPQLQRRYEDLTLTRTRVVAYLRAKVGPELDDPFFAELLTDLMRGSPAFRDLWVRHDLLAVGDGGLTGFLHPKLGAIRLRYSTFTVRDAEGLTLPVYHAAPGHPDALEALLNLTV